MRTVTHGLLKRYGDHLAPRGLGDGQVHRLAAAYDRAAEALGRLEEGVERSREIRAHPDLTAEAKDRKVRELLAPLVNGVRSSLEHNRSVLVAHRDRMRQQLEDAGRGKGEGWEVVAREIRLDRATRALEALPRPDRARLMLEAASRGDRSLIDAARTSYLPLVEPESLNIAENRWALVAHPNELAAVEDAGELLEAVEHLAITVEGGVLRRVLGEDFAGMLARPSRRDDDPSPVVEPAEVEAIASAGAPVSAGQ